MFLRGTKGRGETEWEPQGEEDRDEEGVRERECDFCGPTFAMTSRIFKKKDKESKDGTLKGSSKSK